MNRSIRLVLAVVVTCVVAATGLALTYSVTAPRIAEQDRLAEERSLRSVQPDAEDFEPVEDADLIAEAGTAAAPVEVEGVYRALRDGAPIGWALKVSSRGYGGPMLLVIGLDTSGSVTGVSVLSHNETAGLGTKVITEPGYLEQFSQLEGGFTDADVRGFDVISGSTRSSNGIRNGVAAAGRIFATVLTGMEGGSE